MAKTLHSNSSSDKEDDEAELDLDKVVEDKNTTE